MSVFSLLEEVKESLRPDKEIIAVRDEVLSRINTALKKRDIDAHAVPGGSVAKDTYLPLDHDVDVFVRFSLEYATLEEQLPDTLERVLSEFKPARVHGSRDYFMFTHQGYEFEIIPVLAIEDASQARNVTDASPLHVKYFLLRGQGLEDEVRLAKQFCKAAGVYGAESYIRGFSGHVIDLLIMHYGAFYRLLQAAASWKPPVIIDSESHHDKPLDVLNEAKLSPLVLIDPVQPDRNAAAALSQEQFDVFVARAQAFITEPSEKFFVIEEFHEEHVLSQLCKHPGSGVWVRVTTDDDKRDVAGARVRKAFERLVSEVRRAGFDIVEDGWHFSFGSESYVWVVVAQVELSETHEREGPPVRVRTDADRFKETHQDVSEREGRLYARVVRDERAVLAVAQRVCAALTSSGKLTCEALDLSDVASTQE